MQTAPGTASTSRGGLWTGRALSGLAVLFLLFDASLKLLKLPVAIDATIQLGYPASAVLVIGFLELICTMLYVIPSTSVLGVVLLTGYLGGAVATHLRHSDPLFSHVLFPTYVGAVLWAGLLLREQRLRAVFPVR